MKIFLIVNVARQINGEFIFVKVEKAFKYIKKAEAYFDSLAKTTKQLIQTAQGFSVECSCEYSMFDVETDE